MLRFLYLLIAVLMVACSDSGRPSGHYFWSPVDPEFDSVALLLQESFVEFVPDSVKESYLAELCSIAAKSPEEEIVQSRLHYWKGRILIKKNKIEEARVELGLARELSDSATYPYDIARIRYEEGLTLPVNAVRQYVEDSKALDYYTSIGDSTMMGAIYISMGSTFRDICDTTRSLEYFGKADNIFRKMGYEATRNLSLLNMSNLYDRMKADSVLAIVRESPGIERNMSLYGMVLFNSYIHTRNRNYLMRLLSLIEDDKEYRSGVAHVEALIATDMFAEGYDCDSATVMADHAWQLLEDDDVLTTKVVVTQAKAYALRAQGRNDSAYLVLEEAQDLYNNWVDLRRANEVLAMDHKVEVGNMENERKMAHRRYVTILIAVMSACAVISGILYLRLKSIRLSKKRAELEMEQATLQKEQAIMETEKERMSLAASKVALECKDRAVQSVNDVIARLKDEHKISPEVAGVITSGLKVYLGDKGELESFQDVHERLNPGFNKILKGISPDITEGQLRLASYIAIGMTNRQIARMLGVEQSSVVKNRYRLRSKLGLEKGESLEEMLRNLQATDG